MPFLHQGPKGQTREPSSTDRLIVVAFFVPFYDDHDYFYFGSPPPNAHFCFETDHHQTDSELRLSLSLPERRYLLLFYNSNAQAPFSLDWLLHGFTFNMNAGPLIPGLSSRLGGSSSKRIMMKFLVGKPWEIIP